MLGLQAIESPLQLFNSANVERQSHRWYMNKWCGYAPIGRYLQQQVVGLFWHCGPYFSEPWSRKCLAFYVIVMTTVEAAVVIKRKKPRSIPDKVKRWLLLENGVLYMMVGRIAVKNLRQILILKWPESVKQGMESWNQFFWNYLEATVWMFRENGTWKKGKFL